MSRFNEQKNTGLMTVSTLLVLASCSMKTQVTSDETQTNIVLTKKEEEYLFVCDVDWGNGDNEITYLFKLNVVSDK